MKTRQAVIVELRRFEIREADVAPANSQVLIKMAGCGMCTSEMWAWTGINTTYPAVMGHEAHGVVTELGPGVERVKVGDRVTGLYNKAYADYYVQPEDQTMVIRPDFEQTHVFGEPLYCVHNVVRAAHPIIGDCVAVVGVGPMGQWAVQALAGRTLHSLVAVDIEDNKLEAARWSGATHVVNSSTENAAERVAAITGGRMADVVVEGTGTQAGVETATRLLRQGHPRLVIMSSFKGPIEVDILRLCGVAAEVIHAHPGIRWNKPDGVRRTEVLINNGVFKTDHLVTHEYPLEGIQTAFEQFECNRPAGYIKGMIVP